MRGRPRRRRQTAGKLASMQRRISQHPIPWLLVALCSLLYAAIGLILASFSVSSWLWGVAIVATIIQVVALAGPEALQRFKWWSANLVAMASILGAGGLTVALSVALNHFGTDQLDNLTIRSVMIEVILLSSLALLIAAFTAWVTARLGDVLLQQFHSRRTTFMLLSDSLLSLGLGAVLGIVVVQGVG